MSKKSGFELDKKGVGELLKSEEMFQALEQYGNVIASNAGSGYGHNRVMSSDRAKVFVRATTAEAERENNENNTLLNAMHG